MEVTEYIPREHFNLWYSLFKQSKGWFLYKPFEGKDDVLVNYAFDDIDSCNELNANYMRLTTPIIETKRGFWKRLKAKFNPNN